MWNYNIKSGTIWGVKSYNEYSDETHEGMTFGTTYVLILSAFVDADNNKKFTYLKVLKNNYAITNFNNYREVKVLDRNNQMKYISIQTDNIFTGDQYALGSFEYNLYEDEFENLIEELRHYFYILQPKKKEKVSKILEKDIDYKYQRIHKFGIDIYVTENENVSITKSNRLLLSEKARNDIIYNSKTDQDIQILCEKYKIYPTKAIKEIRNRLVYQHKQKEG